MSSRGCHAKRRPTCSVKKTLQHSFFQVLKLGIFRGSPKPSRIPEFRRESRMTPIIGTPAPARNRPEMAHTDKRPGSVVDSTRKNLQPQSLTDDGPKWWVISCSKGEAGVRILVGLSFWSRSLFAARESRQVGPVPGAIDLRRCLHCRPEGVVVSTPPRVKFPTNPSPSRINALHLTRVDEKTMWQ